MKVFSFLILSSFTFSAAFAVSMDQTLRANELQSNESFFSSLDEMFKQGTAPDPEKIKNIAWSGRCFIETKPSSPLNAGYIIREKNYGDVGPIGASVKDYEGSTYHQEDQPADFFDEMVMKQVINSLRLNFTKVKMNSDGLYLNYDSFRIKHISILRTYKNYLIETVKVKDNMLVPEARCYYFKPRIQTKK